MRRARRLDGPAAFMSCGADPRGASLALNEAPVGNSVSTRCRGLVESLVEVAVDEGGGAGYDQ